MPIGDLVPNPANPRIHGEDQIERLMAAMKRFGVQSSVLARKANHMVIAGHARLEAMRRLGMTEVPVRLWDVDQATADQFMVADNKLATLARDDKSMLAAVLGEVDDIYPLGFNEAEAAKIVEGMTGRKVAVTEVPVTDVHDEFWIVMKGPLELQNEALTAAKTLLARWPRVSVELGTTKIEFAM